MKMETYLCPSSGSGRCESFPKSRNLFWKLERITPPDRSGRKPKATTKSISWGATRRMRMRMLLLIRDYSTDHEPPIFGLHAILSHPYVPQYHPHPVVSHPLLFAALDFFRTFATRTTAGHAERVLLLLLLLMPLMLQEDEIAVCGRQQ